MHFKGTLVITDPCYLKQTEYDDEPKVRQIMSSMTYYGDWSCTTYQIPKGVEPLEVRYCEEDLYEFGEFTADGGEVCVCLLDELAEVCGTDPLKFIIEHPWCVTVIPGFDGEVEFKVLEITDPELKEPFKELHVVGIDNHNPNNNFVTFQTGL